MNCVDLFCGCGGMSLGFEQAGIDVLCAIDKWDLALDVYQKNFKHDVVRHDLSDVSGTAVIVAGYAPDMIVGGPPCQDFSSAGKRDVTLGRADLTYSFANIVCDVAPNWFVMENVEAITKSHILHDVIGQFQNAKYGLTAVILDASYCSVPQARNRFFLIGELNGKHGALLNVIKSNLAGSPMTVRDYLGDSLGVSHYYRHPRNYSRRGIFSVDEPSPTVRGVNRPIPPSYKKSVCDPDGVELSEIRPLSTIERSYLQTFPKEFIFTGTKTNLEQMIGNAVPVNLAQFVATCILQYKAGVPIQANQHNNLFEDDNPAFTLPQKALHKEAKHMSSPK